MRPIWLVSELEHAKIYLVLNKMWKTYGLLTVALHITTITFPSTKKGNVALNFAINEINQPEHKTNNRANN